MNDPDENQADHDLDALYRRAAAPDASRPSESVRRAVLRHAADLAAGRSRAWRPRVAYVGLAAAGIACLLILPHFVLPPTPDPLARRPLDVSAETSRNRHAVEYASHFNGIPYSHSPASVAGADALAEIAPRPPPVPPVAVPPLAMARRAPAPTPAAATATSAQDMASSLRNAATAGDVARLHALIDQRADLDARDSDGRTALMLAVRNGRTDAVVALLTSGADANAADSGGTTPLQAALELDQPAIAAALRHAGAR